MNMKTILSLGAVGLIVAFSVASFLVGCEDTGTVALTVTPSYADISTSSSNGMQTFTVTAGLRDLSLPLEWEVSNPGLGSIAGAGGNSASYVRTSDAHGDNSIIVRDQYGAEGVATVRQ
jgi:hypothetical protein